MKTKRFFMLWVALAIVAVGKVWAENPIMVFLTIDTYYDTDKKGYYLEGVGTLYSSTSAKKMGGGSSKCGTDELKGLKTGSNTFYFSPAIAITGIKVVSSEANRTLNSVKKGATLAAAATTTVESTAEAFVKDNCDPKSISFTNTIINAGEFLEFKFSGNLSIVSVEVIPAVLPPTLNASPEAISLTTPAGVEILEVNRTVAITGEHLTGSVSLSIAPGTSSGKFSISGGTSITPENGAVNENVVLDVDVSTQGDYNDTLVISSEGVEDVKIPLNLTVTSADNIPPLADTHFPESGATNVPVNTEIYVTLNEPVVRGEGAVTINNGITVSSAEVQEDGTTLVITPSSSLVKATEYTVTLATGAVKDLSGNSNNQITWTFTTDATAPTPQTLFPANGSNNIPVTTDIYAVFSEPLVKGSGAVTVDNNITVSDFTVEDNTTLRITLSDETPLAANVTYTITLAQGAVTDVAGNENAAFSAWTFTIDNTAPAIVSKEPEGESDAPIKPVKITFNENVKIAAASKILVNSEAAAAGASVSGATLTLKDAIQPDNTYTVKLEAGAITDISGNAFEGVEWTFKTMDDRIVFPYHPTFDASYTAPSWMRGKFSYKTNDAGCTSIPSGASVLSVQNAGDTLFIDLPQCGTFTAQIGYTGNSRGLKLFKLGDETPVATVTAPGSEGKSACQTLTYDFNTFDPITLYITLTNSGGRIWDLEITAPVPTPVERVKSYPAAGGENVPVDTRIYAVFDQPIQLVEGGEGQATVNSVAATLSVNGDTLFITPESLENDKPYTVVLDTNVIIGTAPHTAGNAPHTWSFTTVKPDPTQVVIGGRASGTDTLRLGDTWQLSATVSPENAVANTLQWSIESGDGVEITAGGLLSATGSVVGTARIAAAVEGYSTVVGYLDVTLVAVPAPSKYMPLAEATAVAVATPVYVVYSHPIQLLNDAGIGIDNSVTTSVSVNGDTLFITPSADLDNEITYTVSVPAGAVADATYSNLVAAEALSWSFTTEESGYVAPDSVVISGGGAVSLNSPLQLTAAVWKGGALVEETDDDFAVTWSVTDGTDKVEVSSEGLVTAKASATVGSATIRATVSAATSYFGEKIISVEVIPDTIANALTPPHNATGVALDATISMAFNQNVVVVNSGGITVNEVAVQNASVNGNVVTLTPATALVNDLGYTVNIPVGAIKAATSSLVTTSAYTWTFRTVRPDPSEVKITGGTAVYVGDELQLSAEALPGNAITKNVTWSIASGDAATVDEDGKVTGVSVGVAVVKATVTGYDDVFATLEVSVSKSSLQAPDGTYFVFHETFENAVEGSLLSAANGTDETGYVMVGGDVPTISGGVLTMNNSRWKTKNMNLTGEDVTLWVKVRSAEGADNSKKFQIAIDVEGTSGVGGLGNHLISALPASTDNFTLLTISVTGGTASSFIHFRTENGAKVDIEEIAIYKKGAIPPVAIAKRYPAADGENVPVDARIYAVFDQPVQLVGGEGKATVNEAEATLSVNGDTLFITPAESLEYDEQYAVSLDTNVVIGTAPHTAGNAPYAWSFATVRPAPTQVAIAHRASDIDTLRLGDTWQLSATVSPENAVSTTLQWSVVSGNVEITAGGLLSATGSVVGTARIAVAVEGYSEITDYLDITLVAAPAPSNQVPGENATAVAIATPVYVVYSHPIQLLNDAGIGIDNSVTASISVNGDTLFITPSADLVNETQYTVSVPAGAIADATYPNLVAAEALSWNFTTAAEGYVAPDSVVISGGSAVSQSNPLQLTAAVWKAGAPVGDTDNDFAVIWSVTGGADRVEVNDAGLVTAKESATVGVATIRAAVSNATSYFGEKNISVEVIPDTIANAFTPPHNATGVALDATFSIAFNQSVEVVSSGDITVNNAAVQEASVNGNVVTLTPAEALLNDYDYTVSVPAGAIKAATSSFVTTSAYTWTFRTVQPDPSEVRITGGTAVGVDGELQLSAEVLPENAIAKDVVWSIESGTAATVDAASGKVTGVSAGVAVVKATVAGYDDVYATLEVSVGKTSLQAPEGTYFVFHETFENAVEGSLLGAANGTDETGYVIGSGGNNTKISGGVLTMLGSRWQTKNLDLTGEDVTLLVKVRQNVSVPETGKRFQLAIDTAGSSGVNNLGSYYIAADLPASTEAFMLLEKAITAGTVSSFIHFRTESASSVDIDEIAIYKKDAATGEPNTPVAIEEHSPAAGAVDVPVDALIYAVFDQPIQLVGGGQATVNDAAATLSVSGDTLFITPAAPLGYNLTYTVGLDTNVVTGTADHTAGNAPYTWSFTTASVTSPPEEPTPPSTPVAIEAHSPAADAVDVPVDALIYAVFDQPIQLVGGEGKATVNDAAATLSVSGDTLFIALSAPLVNAQQYTVSLDTNVVTGTADHTAGNAPYTWSFTTASVTSPPEEPTPPSTPVAIEAHYPAVGGANVPVDARIYAVFDQPVQLVGGEGKATVNDAAATLSVSGDTLFIAPAVSLVNAQQYTVSLDTNVVAGTADHTAGNAPYTWSFTTASVTSPPEEPNAVAQTSVAAVKVYPNPATTILNVVNNGDYATVQIVSTAGSLLYTGSIAKGKNSINVGFLKHGVYFVRLSASKTKSYTVKLIVEGGI